MIENSTSFIRAAHSRMPDEFVGEDGFDEFVDFALGYGVYGDEYMSQVYEGGDEPMSEGDVDFEIEEEGEGDDGYPGYEIDFEMEGIHRLFNA